ncbi:MAG: glycosyltransferase [Proteobacteria bacterium]|nr:glycosyltransferase [Pseudomonadota bacterium]MBU1059657.1 glycosyltransferase [Pseudomonadota bacterium]
MNAAASPSTLGYILKGYPRISETFISNEILLLEQLGYRLRLFPMRHPRETFCHDSVKQIKARVDYLPTELLLDFPRLLSANILLAGKRPAQFREGLALAGRRYHRNGKLATFKHLLQAGFLTQNHLLKDPSLTHLHGHFAHSPTSVTMFASLLSGCSFSFTAHAKDIYTSNPEQLLEKIERASFVVTCTDYNRRYLRQLAPETDTPLYCIYHGIDLQLFSHTTDHCDCAPPYKLLTIARMTEKKGLPTLYQALRILKDKGVQFSHTLIGDGDERDKLLQLITDLGLDECCHWLGTRSHTDVLKQFTESDLFVLACEIAANGDRDGIPNVLVESLAMGVPALSTAVSAIPEILIHQKTGLTVPPGEPQILAATIEEILLDKELRQRLIAAGAEHTRHAFDNRSLVAELGRIFAKQLASCEQKVLSASPYDS